MAEDPFAAALERQLGAEQPRQRRPPAGRPPAQRPARQKASAAPGPARRNARPAPAQDPAPAAEPLTPPPPGGRTRIFRQRFEELTSSGIPKEIAFQQAMLEAREFVGPPEDRSATPTESFATGASQGATAGFADELFGALDAVAGAFTPFSATGVRDPKASVLDEYRQTRDALRAQEQSSEQANPKAALAGEIVGGVLTGAATGGATGIAQSVPRALAVGAAEGAATGLGESEADLTRGDVAGAAQDVAIGGAFGATGAGVMKIGGAIARRTPWLRTKAAAGQIAREIGETLDEPSNIGFRESVSDFTKRSDEVEDWAKSVLGDEDLVPFSIAQRTGSPAAAMRETAERQFPELANRAQARLAAQTRQAAKILESTVNEISADPSKLGRASVGQELSDSIEGYVSGLVKQRSEIARNLFGRADELAGGDPVMPVRAFKRRLNELIQDGRSPLSPPNKQRLADQLQTMLDGLGDVQGLRPSEFNNALSDWGSAAAGSGDIFKDIEAAKGKRVARELFGALQDDLDSAVAGGKGGVGRGEKGQFALFKNPEAAEALKVARDTYRVMSEEIDNAGFDAIKRVLKLEGKGTPDKITEKLLSKGTSPEQVRGVFDILETASPVAARNARAQLIEDILVKGGKPLRGATSVREKGISQLNPMGALKQLADAEPTVRAAFGDDRNALKQYDLMLDYLQRLAGTQKRGLEGAQTAPLAQEFANMVGARGGVSERALRLAGKVTSDSKAFAKAASEAEGIEVVNKVLKGIIDGTDISDEVAGAFVATMVRLGVNEAVEQPESRVTEAGKKLGEFERQRDGALGGRR